jgi:endonuclease G
MNPQEKIGLLKSMLAQVAQDRIGALEIPGRAPAGAAFESLAEASNFETLSQEQEAAVSAIGKMKDGQEQQITPREADLLEAIILPRERPVVFVRNGTYEDVESPWTHLNAAQARAVVNPLLPSIGRIEVPNMPWVPYGGTGFVVGPDLLMTNRHVARLFCEGTGRRSLVYRAGDAAVDFKREENTPADDRSLYFTVRAVVMVHPYWDMAILRVEGLPATIKPLTLSVAEPEAIVGEDVVAIGYPARDDRNDLALQDRIFKRKFNVKRLQPGRIRVREKIRSFENVVDAMTHDTSTLGGNSGSALVHVKTGEIVGLHFAGVYLKANYAVPAYELARDSRVVDAGVKFAKTVAFTGAWDDAWRRVEESVAGDGSGATSSTAGTATTAPAVSSGVAASAAGATATFTIPLNVTVSMGTPSLAGGPGGRQAILVSSAPGGALVEAPRMQVPVIFDGLEHRAGYQPDFLGGTPLPLPARTALGKTVTAKLEDGSDELKYHKFSVVMHRGRRLALLTAANLDWRPDSRLVDGKKPTRGELTGIPQGTAEEWVMDWRIPEEHQLPDIFFTKDRGSFDKGHLVRRDDVAWGPSFEDIQMSNGDTYHTTNCSPQTSEFNQSSRGEDNWGDLENMVQKETNAEKAIVFSGPVLAANDPIFEGLSLDGPVKVRIPRKFWKIVVVEGEGGLEAYGFVLKHDLSDVVMRPEEFAVPVRWQRFMKPIGDIEALLKGLVTMEDLRAVDRFDSSEGVRMRAQLS